MELLFEKKFSGAETIDLDKAFDGIVWLLNRMPSPPDLITEGAGFVLPGSLVPLLNGDKMEKRIEAPYGPAKSLTSEQVAKLGGWLQNVDITLLRSHYDPKSMATGQVYPQIWMEEGIAAFDEYLLPNFQRLRDFFSRATNSHQEVLVFFA